MTRKHFRALAHFLGTENISRHMVDQMADFCKSQNGNFNRDRFIAAVEKIRPAPPK